MKDKYGHKDNSRSFKICTEDKKEEKDAIESAYHKEI